MRNAILVFLGLTMTAWAQALTVSESEIAGKSNLVLIATVSVNGKMEQVLTDNKGFTLYTFALDKPNTSVCSGGCLQEWPPEHVSSTDTATVPFATLKGNDGQVQLMLKDLPLYHYTDDQKPGQAFGNYPEWSVIQVIN